MERPKREFRFSILHLLALLGILLVVVQVAGWLRTRGGEPESISAVQVGPRCLDGIPEVDIPVPAPWRTSWSRLGDSDCRPGTWLYQFREDGQNLADYRLEASSQVPQSTGLAVRRLTPFEDARALGLTPPVVEFLSLFFQREVVEISSLPLPASSSRLSGEGHTQHDAQDVISALVGTCPGALAGCLALTDEDLFATDLEYVFGLGHFRERVGVMSTFRLWEPAAGTPAGFSRAATEGEALRRVLKIASHEMSHQLGVAHCVHYGDCLMGGTNSLEASDQAQLRLCPLDHEKLAWRMGFDEHRRFSDLAAFGRRHGLHREAAYWERMARSAPALPNAAGGGGP